MNIVLLLAIIAFLTACIWSTIQRAWPMAFLSAGLLLLALNTSNLLTN